MYQMKKLGYVRKADLYYESKIDSFDHDEAALEIYKGDLSKSYGQHWATISLVHASIVFWITWFAPPLVDRQQKGCWDILIVEEGYRH